MEGGGQEFCLYECDYVYRVVGDCREVSQSLRLVVIFPEQVVGVTEDEYFESERERASPKLLRKT